MRVDHTAEEQVIALFDRVSREQNTAGIIGIPVLRAFSLVFDYPNRRVAVAQPGTRIDTGDWP